MPLPVVTFYSRISPDAISQTWSVEFHKSGVVTYSPEDYLISYLENPDWQDSAIIMFVGTGGTEELVAEFAQSLHTKPQMILLTHPRDNSLPASMEIRTYLSSNGFEVSIIHKPREDIIRLLKDWTRFSKHLEHLSQTRIGLIGKPSSWLIASNVDLATLNARWGIEFIEYDFAILEQHASDGEHNLSQEFQKKAAHVHIPADKVDEAAEMANTLLCIIRSENLDGVTVQCFDFLVKNKVSGCLALCHANNQDGIIAGCEGDIPTTITMLIAKELTGSPSFMANVTHVDTDDNSAILAHCTVPTSIVKDYDLLTHFETNMSVGVRGRFEQQPVTVVKVFGDELTDYWVSTGELIENLLDPDGCRTQIRIRFEEDVKYFLERSFANHHVVIPGDHKDELEEFFSFMKLMS